MANGRWPEEGRILTNSATGDRLREPDVDLVGFDFYLEAGLLNAGVQAVMPVASLYCQPCQGQVTIPPET